MTQPGEITVLLREWSEGKPAATEQLFELVYPQLRKIAGALFRGERPENMLQPTSVVNELFLKLIRQRSLRFEDREHFYSLSARLMRRVLVDHARSEERQKRDGGIPVPLHDELVWCEMRGNVPTSLPLYQRAYDGYKTCSGAESRGALTEQEYQAGVLIKLGRSQEALPMMEAAMPVWRKMMGTSPDLSEPLNFLAMAELGTGHYLEGEKTAKEMVDVQAGKVEPSDRRFGASHLLWARALVGQHRYQEALPHAEIADKLLAMNAVSVGGKKAASDAHQVLLDIQSNLAGSNKHD